MGMSRASVEKAYEVFNEIKRSVMPELNIRSWPDDWVEYSDDQKKDPPLNVVIGCDKKYDDGWECLNFFVKNPSKELKDKFKELAVKIPNTSICKPYSVNKSLYIFGWF